MPSDNGSLTGSKAAMIVVDMQNASLSDEGSMNKSGMDITELKKTVAKAVTRQSDLSRRSGLL